MSIKDLLEKIKPFYTVILLIVVASIFFALGRLSAIEERHQPVKILNSANTETDAGPGMEDGTIVATTSAVEENSVTASAVLSNQSGIVIGNKTSKKLYLPWCAGLKRVKPENRVQFDSVEAAKAVGYVPSGNCKGIQ